MRQVAVLCGIVLILAFRADAQVSSGTSLLLGSPMPAFAFASPAAGAVAAAPGANASALAAAPEPAPQGVYGVLQNYNWQAYAGYTHFTFYEIPGVTGNLNGFNMSLVFYPHGGHIGADGEFAAAFAPEAGVNTTMALGMGGSALPCGCRTRHRVMGAWPRRWSAFHAPDRVWKHKRIRVRGGWRS